jgi:hypothetical protein
MSVAIIVKMTTLTGRLALLIREDSAVRAQYFLRVKGECAGRSKRNMSCFRERDE